MKKTEVALQTRDGNEALRYSGKDRALIIYLDYITYFLSTWYVTSSPHNYSYIMYTLDYTYIQK